MISDPFASVTDTLISPARHAFAITPDDGAPLQKATKAIYVGGSGDLNLRLIDGAEDVTLRNVAAGSVLAVRVAAIKATGTSATDIVGLA